MGLEDVCVWIAGGQQIMDNKKTNKQTNKQNTCGCLDQSEFALHVITVVHLTTPDS